MPMARLCATCAASCTCSMCGRPGTEADLLGLGDFAALSSAGSDCSGRAEVCFDKDCCRTAAYYFSCHACQWGRCMVCEECAVSWACPRCQCPAEGMRSARPEKAEAGGAQACLPRDLPTIHERTSQWTEGSMVHMTILRCVERNAIVEVPASFDASASASFALGVTMRSLDSAKRSRKAVMLAPTVPMVKHIYGVAEAYDGLRACQVIGNWEVDAWEKAQWEEHLLRQDLMITTPQLFLDTLNARYLDLAFFGVLVMHECQHCSGRHPFAKLFSEHYWKPGCQGKFRVLGLCRHIVKHKMKDASERQEAIRRLEKTMDAHVVPFEGSCT